jgi:hypothetical protein
VQDLDGDGVPGDGLGGQADASQHSLL